MDNKKKNVVADKSYSFALRIIKLYKHLVAEHKEYVLSKQILRSGTSIGALVKEAEQAQSKADFLNKIKGIIYLLTHKKITFIEQKALKGRHIIARGEAPRIVVPHTKP